MHRRSSCWSGRCRAGQSSKRLDEKQRRGGPEPRGRQPLVLSDLYASPSAPAAFLAPTGSGTNCRPSQCGRKGEPESGRHAKAEAEASGEGWNLHEALLSSCSLCAFTKLETDMVGCCLGLEAVLAGSGAGGRSSGGGVLTGGGLFPVGSVWRRGGGC